MSISQQVTVSVRQRWPIRRFKDGHRQSDCNTFPLAFVFGNPTAGGFIFLLALFRIPGLILLLLVFFAAESRTFLTEIDAMRCSIILACLLLASSASAQESRPPNIILILADDLGWTDVGCQGTKYYETPNIDKLAARGLRLTSLLSEVHP
jgi:hypothetical protein